MSAALELSDFRASIGDLEILKGVDLTVPFGEIHVLMGPNGSGKSTLCHALMGKKEYRVDGSAKVAGVDILGLDVAGRARAGLFQAFQYPVEIPGVRLSELVEEMRPNVEKGFDERVEAATERLAVERFLARFVNSGLSGGEKKRSEMYQLAVARPKVAVLDEIDSGLDVDAVREVAGLVEDMRGPNVGVLIITHYSRILRYMSPDRIHVLVSGRIVQSGGAEVAEQLETDGYEAWRPARRQELPVVDPLAGL